MSLSPLRPAIVAAALAACTATPGGGSPPSIAPVVSEDALPCRQPGRPVLLPASGYGAPMFGPDGIWVAFPDRERSWSVLWTETCEIRPAAGFAGTYCVTLGNGLLRRWPPLCQIAGGGMAVFDPSLSAPVAITRPGETILTLSPDASELIVRGPGASLDAVARDGRRRAILDAAAGIVAEPFPEPGAEQPVPATWPWLTAWCPCIGCMVSAETGAIRDVFPRTGFQILGWTASYVWFYAFDEEHRRDLMGIDLDRGETLYRMPFPSPQWLLPGRRGRAALRISPGDGTVGISRIDLATGEESVLGESPWLPAERPGWPVDLAWAPIDLGTGPQAIHVDSGLVVPLRCARGARPGVTPVLLSEDDLALACQQLLDPRPGRPPLQVPEGMVGWPIAWPGGSLLVDASWGIWNPETGDSHHTSAPMRPSADSRRLLTFDGSEIGEVELPSGDEHHLVTLPRSMSSMWPGPASAVVEAWPDVATPGEWWFVRLPEP